MKTDKEINPVGVGAVKVIVSSVDHEKARIVVDEYESKVKDSL